MTLTLDYISKLCIKLDKLACRSLDRNSYDDAISYYSALSFLKYSFYFGLKDDKIEESIKLISLKIKSRVFFLNNRRKTVVLLDNFTSDNKALTQQYLEALINCGFKFLYIHNRNLEDSVCRYIRSILLSYDKADSIQVPSNLRGLQRSQWIYDTICKYGADKLLMQLMPNAIEECIAISALPRAIIRYQINLTDHTFWIGTGCTDFSLEFRHYGCNLSINQRGLMKEKILLMPYYPIMKNVPFQGFPKETEKKVIFFTGGSPYKVVDKEQTFFQLCKDILNSCPNAVILFAGANHYDLTIDDAIARFGLKGRMIPIGQRSDIFEVFKHCDIYINTYPFGGGLMCQFAAQCSKPILNYKLSNIEEVVAQKQNCKFTSLDREAFIDEAKKLYNNQIYRAAKGKELKACVITKKEFEVALEWSLSTNSTFYPIEWDTQFVLHQFNQDGIVDYHNRSWGIYYKLFSILGKNFFSVAPRMYLNLQIHRISKKIKKK